MTDTTLATTTALPEWTPVQIDTELKRLGQERAVLVARVNNLRHAVELAREGRRPDHARAARLEAEAEQYLPRIAELRAQMKPYEDEFDRRGGWARAFLVLNNGGHVHSSTHCSTCYLTTRYEWLTDYSGRGEDEIVYASGELACTACYPSAPVDVLKRVGEIRRPGDVEREQRAAAKAAKVRAAAAEAVIDPNTGRTLYKSVRAATNALSTVLSSIRWYGLDHPDGPKWTQTVDSIVEAVAAKQGADPAALKAELEAKADDKFNRGARKVWRDIEQRGGEIDIDNLLPGLKHWVKTNVQAA